VAKGALAPGAEVNSKPPTRHSYTSKNVLRSHPYWQRGCPRYRHRVMSMTDECADSGRPALRIVHLPGGLRAYDIGDANIRIGPDLRCHLLSIPTQPYRRVYLALGSIGLDTLGVDFITNTGPISELQPPDFHIYTAGAGFAAMTGERAWSDVKNVPEQATAEILNIAGRFTTYHRLLTLRIRDLSEAYRACLLLHLTDLDGKYAAPVEGQLFSNLFRTHIEAAMHAFLADAAGLRDLIAETIWRLVLNRSTREVTTLATILKRTRSSPAEHPLLAELHAAGAEGRWLKVLTDLRNAIIHIAPLGNTHELHLMQLRLNPVKGGVVPGLHFPLTAADGTVRPRSEPIEVRDEAQFKARRDTYRDFVDGSGDALAYACQTTALLIGLAARVRVATGLRQQMLQITDADIVGKVRIFKGGVELRAE